MRKKLTQLFTLVALVLGLTLGPVVVTRAASPNGPEGGITTCAMDHGGSGG